MIKCNVCGEEFSYGRKISCCDSTHFGIIFSNDKKDHIWNCNFLLKPKIEKIPDSKEEPDLIIVESNPPIPYNWNCNTFDILKNPLPFE